jgi:phage terminase large subunit
MAMVDEDSEVPGALKKDRNIYKMDLFDCFRYFFQTFFKDYATRITLGKAA